MFPVSFINWLSRKKKMYLLSEQQAEKLYNNLAELNVSIWLLALSPCEN